MEADLARAHRLEKSRMRLMTAPAGGVVQRGPAPDAPCPPRFMPPRKLTESRIRPADVSGPGAGIFLSA